MTRATPAIAIRITNKISRGPLLSSIHNLHSKQSTQSGHFRNNTTFETMNLRCAAFGALVATSSAWISPASVSMKRSFHQGVTTQTEQQARTHKFSTRQKTTLCSAVEAPSSSDATAGRPIAMGSIVNVFRGGLVAARIDDDLSKVKISLEVSVPDIVDPSQSVPDEIKSKNSENDMGGDLTGRQVMFSDGKTGIVVVHRPPLIFAYKENKDEEEPSVEGAVTVLDNLYSLAIPDNLQRTDCFGKNVATCDETAETKTLKRPIFAPIPQVKDISLINKPLVTGVTMFDALAPIGKGQNMLLVGHDLEDMRRYALDMVSVQKSRGVKCIYASTGDETSQSDLKTIMDSLGFDEKDLVLVSSEDTKKSNRDEASNTVEGIVTAATACSIGEAYALEEGMDTFIIIDSINQHKKFWDTTTRTLVDVFGIDSVVKGDRDGGASSEMRAFFSSLVQRSAQFNKKRGGGSVTLLLMQAIPKMVAEEDESDLVFSPADFEGSPAKIQERLDLLVKKNIPLTAATLRKIQIPVPSTEEGLRRLALQHVDDLISMSDGQIWLDERLQNKGRNPAMDFQRSITRIGIGADTQSRADAPAMRRVVEGLRLDLSQAESMEGADFESIASKKQVRSAQAWLLAMHQPPSSEPRNLSESCVALLAASSGALDTSIDSGILAGSEEGTELIRSLLDHVNKNATDCMEEIDSTLDFSDETKISLQEAITAYFDQK
jgi:F0F1-type ATP synthase alpha subunit